MENYAAVLERIAKALEQANAAEIASAPDPWITLVVGGVLGGILALVGRWLVWEYQQRRVTREKRELFCGLIGDEIDLRWRPHIGQDLKDLFNKEFDLRHVRGFCNNMVLTDRDLPIFKMAYERALELNVFVKKSVVSQMIYVNVLFNDLRDAQGYLVKLLSEFDGETDDRKTDLLRGRIEENWARMKKVVGDIDEQSSLIFEAISDDYNEFKKEGNGKAY